jgi:hypothetical protein
MLIAIEQFKVTAISIRGKDDLDYILEGDDLYYYLADIKNEKYENI